MRKIRRTIGEIVELVQNAKGFTERQQVLRDNDSPELRWWLYQLYGVDVTNPLRKIDFSGFKGLITPGYTDLLHAKTIKKLGNAFKLETPLRKAEDDVWKMLEIVNIKDASFLICAIKQNAPCKGFTKKLIQETFTGLIEDKIGVTEYV